jgi:hypothetical protein
MQHSRVYRVEVGINADTSKIHSRLLPEDESRRRLCQPKQRNGAHACGREIEEDGPQRRKKDKNKDKDKDTDTDTVFVFALWTGAQLGGQTGRRCQRSGLEAER